MYEELLYKMAHRTDGNNTNTFVSIWCSAGNNRLHKTFRLLTLQDGIANTQRRALMEHATLPATFQSSVKIFNNISNYFLRKY
jgi:hypothetical protein